MRLLVAGYVTHEKEIRGEKNYAMCGAKAALRYKTPPFGTSLLDKKYVSW